MIKTDWPEDAAHENGNYRCECQNCGTMFVGLKRRNLCRACHDPLEQVGCWYITQDYSNSDPHCCRKPCVPGTLHCADHQV